MTVFALDDRFIFPYAEQAEPDGLLAIGGDLAPGRILEAYKNGIFPWYSQGQPILWWSPNPRLTLFPQRLHISKSLRRVLRSGKYEVKFDTRFQEVIKLCAGVKRSGQDATWITENMIAAYCRLHELGYCHSAEVFFQGKLVGGLYGISLGKAFFGESMFSLKSDASKTALATLTRKLMERDFHFIDCQVSSEHLKKLGAVEIGRQEFMKLLSKAMTYPTSIGKWTYSIQPFNEKPQVSDFAGR